MTPLVWIAILLAIIVTLTVAIGFHFGRRSALGEPQKLDRLPPGRYRVRHHGRIFRWNGFMNAPYSIALVDQPWMSWPPEPRYLILPKDYLPGTPEEDYQEVVEVAVDGRVSPITLQEEPPPPLNGLDGMIGSQARLCQDDKEASAGQRGRINRFLQMDQ